MELNKYVVAILIGLLAGYAAYATVRFIEAERCNMSLQQECVSYVTRADSIYSLFKQIEPAADLFVFEHWSEFYEDEPSLIASRDSVFAEWQKSHEGQYDYKLNFLKQD